MHTADGSVVARLDQALGISAIVRAERTAAEHASATSPASGPAEDPPSKAAQIKVLTKALARMRKLPLRYLGNLDVFAFGVGALWRKGIDGAGTTVAVLEGWNYSGIRQQVVAFDNRYGLPNPRLTTIYPAGRLPGKCPAGMVRLGSYGSCQAWAGELIIDVLAAHLMAPYANIVISATPADTQVTEDAASQVAPPEMMKAVEAIAARHLANVISISDGTGESSYSHGRPEILAQDPGELAAAAAGIPLLVATGDCGVVQNLPAASSQCGDTTTFPDTAAFDDSPWVTAVGGNIPVLNKRLQLARPPTLWSVNCSPVPSRPVTCSSGAGFSKVFARPGYQQGVAAITGSGMRSVPDITMDGTFGTSEASPLFAGILALATQQNKANLGPINPVLYSRLGPAGIRAGIQDVIGGDNSFTLRDGTVVPGFTAVKGFDIASGWGTVSAPAFVPALAAATRADHEETIARRQARADLARLERATTLTPAVIGRTATAKLTGSGFLPLHPVRIYLDGRYVATRRASDTGTIDYPIRPSRLGLKPGRHTATLSSLLLTEHRSFAVRG
jgi:subtilase family serine protease